MKFLLDKANSKLVPVLQKERLVNLSQHKTNYVKWSTERKMKRNWTLSDLWDSTKQSSKLTLEVPEEGREQKTVWRNNGENVY